VVQCNYFSAVGIGRSVSMFLFWLWALVAVNIFLLKNGSELPDFSAVFLMYS